MRTTAPRQLSLAAIEDVWQRRATAAAIAAARKVVAFDGPIPPGTPIGRLGDVGWGWLVVAILFGWIATRAEQADRRAHRHRARDPDDRARAGIPWDAGAITSILPELAEKAAGIDWAKPLAEWPRESMVEFLTVAFGLIRKAVTARDLSTSGITRKSNAAVIARQANAAAGGPLLTPESSATGSASFETGFRCRGPQSCEPIDRRDQRRAQRRDRTSRCDHSRITATLSRRQRCRRRLSAQNAIRLVVHADASPVCAGVFDRGHYFEERFRQLLGAAGFKFAPPEALEFTAVNRLLRGHADGVIIAGPDGRADLSYPLIWEHKAINAKNWRALERDGLEKTFPRYAAQVALYQAYLDVTNPALFTALNADTCEQLHLSVPFNAERAQPWSDRAVTIIKATQRASSCRESTAIRPTGIAGRAAIRASAGGSRTCRPSSPASTNADRGWANIIRLLSSTRTARSSPPCTP